jgi:hypothetical protein
VPPRENFLLRVLKNKIVRIGGSNVDKSSRRDVYVYDVSSNVWSKGNDMPDGFALPRMGMNIMQDDKQLVLWVGAKIVITPPTFLATYYSDGALLNEDLTWSMLHERSEFTSSLVRVAPAAFLANNKLCVWSGALRDRKSSLTIQAEPSGFSLDLTSRTFLPMSDKNAIEAKGFANAVWADSAAIIWGGATNTEKFTSGGVFIP